MATIEDELADAPDSTGETAGTKRASRRHLLKLAGAAVAGAAGMAAMKAVPASANDGDTVTVGTVFSETAGLSTGVSSNSYTYFGALRGSTSYGIGVFGYSFNYGAGVFGRAVFGRGAEGQSYFGTGVVGYGGPYGTWGSGSISGLVGYSTATYGTGAFALSHGSYSSGVKGIAGASYSSGVYGSTTAVNSIGVVGYSKFREAGRFRGYAGSYSTAFGKGAAAMVALSYSGPDALLNGTGRLVQTYNGAGTGAPSFNPSGGGYFEAVRTNDGGFWASTGTGVGQAAWKRINALRVDTADGTGGVYQPFRVKDTRGGPRPAKGTFTPVTIANQGSGAQAIPANAIAVVGNLTATNWSGPGYLTISPWSASPIAPNTSTVNFGGNAQSAIANSFVIGLNAGKVDVFAGAAACHFIIDITGYIQ